MGFVEPTKKNPNTIPIETSGLLQAIQHTHPAGYAQLEPDREKDKQD